ncbi:MAG: hypothetical protein AUH30_07350 [Candidatus Rokubacteria bacterium 13_1_40CM_68_15]|nr:MAG: hypothetical protein AUH30_07350 [Candidatus Rokubacteria bacterium 13_1_40CM_68_15]
MWSAIAIIAALLGLTIASAPAGAQQVLSPYRDQQFSKTRGRSDAEVGELRNGTGMGLARAAELNGYPGPRHVLDAVAAGQLLVTPEQNRRVVEIFDEMAGRARSLGGQIITEETALEMAFRAGTIAETDLRRRVSRIAVLRGELRAVHLGAHLETRALLSAAQIGRYNELRGYKADSEQPHNHQRH